MVCATTAVAWLKRADPIIVFATGYVCAIHAERLWDFVLANWRFVRKTRARDDAKKVPCGTGKHSGMG